MLTSKRKYLPFFMWLLPLLFFMYQFILRLWPGLMMHQIMDQFSIDASHFGMLAAFYYYGYAGMQIPVAMLLDKFGARSVIFTFAVICGLATLVFTYTDNFWLALMSRFLIGAGSAVGFLGVSKVVSEWFPKEHYARMISFSFTFGLIGALYGGKPISILIETHSWQNVALVLAIASIVIGCVAYLALRSPAKSQSERNEIQPLKITSLRQILSSPIIWLLALSNLLMVGALEGFADVWGVQYLMMAYNLGKGDAAGLVSFVFIGMIFGGPLLAFCSHKWGNYPIIALSGLGMALAFFLLFSSQFYNYWFLTTLFFSVGLLCCYQVIVFSAGSDLVAPQHLGITVAFLNCINMLGGSFFHTSIGRIMDVLWTGEVSNEGLKIYSLEVYQYSLSIIPISALTGTMIVAMIAMITSRKNSRMVSAELTS